MQYILTTVGLSSLTNGLRGKMTSKEIYDHSNEKEPKKEFIERFEPHWKDLQQNILNFSVKELTNLSAELNALLRYNRFDKSDTHRLLCTDTYLSQKAAQIVATFLKSKNLNVSIYTPKDLKTDDIESFHFALADMVNDLSQEIQGYKTAGYEIVFNLTGGFKSVNSFLQTMASLYADKSLYIFETSEELLTIPRIPIKVDETVFIENVQVFRALELGLTVDSKKVEQLPKTLVMQVGNEYALSPWGVIVWQKIKDELYTHTLVDPLGKIIYTTQLKKDFEKLSPNEKRQFNKKIDLLEKMLITGHNPSSLRYHALTGQVAAQFSHEFYPFDGNESRRAYCNEKEGYIIIEKIDAHLK